MIMMKMIMIMMMGDDDDDDRPWQNHYRPARRALPNSTVEAYVRYWLS